MLRQILNWRTALAITAIAIVSGTILYSNHLAKKLSSDERKKVSVWVQSLKTRAATTDTHALDLTNIITTQNTDIPIIETDENDNPSPNGYLNLDSARVKADTNYLKEKVKEFKDENIPEELEVSKTPLIINKYYYGESELLKQVRYYPLVQLFIVTLFIFIVVYSISTRNKSTQNQVWAGLAKETAHQLGTPISSLQGWVEILKDNEDCTDIADEMFKDIDRLKLISDRFGKIGSMPKLEIENVTDRVEKIVEYIKKRSSDRVTFNVASIGEVPVLAPLSGPLFDWVTENLLKNALDAMDGKGTIRILINSDKANVKIDVTDTGKGISHKNFKNVFKPGFTTKKRGWGLGLSLAKRIIEQYHGGHLYVKSSEINKGTTFRIVLNK